MKRKKVKVNSYFACPDHIGAFPKKTEVFYDAEEVDFDGDKYEHVVKHVNLRTGVKREEGPIKGPKLMNANK